MTAATASGSHPSPRFILLLGPPAAGKGTQAPRLAEWLGVPHVATGDMFRLAIREGTPGGLAAKEYQAAGRLVPDELVHRIVAERLDRSDCRHGAVLDGFPRNLGQARWLEGELKARGGDGRLAAVASGARRLAGMPADAALGVIALELPEAEIVRRLGGRRTCPGCQASYHLEFAPPAVAGVCDRCGTALVQRPDDNDESIRTRLGVYRDETAVLLSFYADRLVRVSALGAIDEISARLRDCFAR